MNYVIHADPADAMAAERYLSARFRKRIQRCKQKIYKMKHLFDS